MDQFLLYFDIGKEHILDFGLGLDHILFVVVLAASTDPGEWKRLLLLVTAFTVGHSLTLALATMDVIRVDSPLVEFMIVMTILVTALYNILSPSWKSAGNLWLRYAVTLFFGLIHGMGFSTMLRALLADSGEIVSPLFAFNVGLEYGQIIVVVFFSLLAFLVTELAGANRRDWKLVVSSMACGISLLLLKDRFSVLFD